MRCAASSLAAVISLFIEDIAAIMAKHKPLSILRRGAGEHKKRQTAQHAKQTKAQKRQHLSLADEDGDTPRPAGKSYGASPMNAHARKKQCGPGDATQNTSRLLAGAWQPVSVVDRQAAWAVAQLLRADMSGRGGASIKSLTLGPSIQAKKATYAVTCQTLKLLPVLKQLLEGCTLLQQNPGLASETAYVLMYEVLFGEGCRLRGPAEKAILAVRDDLSRLLDAMKAEAGVEDVEALLSAELQHMHKQQQPRSARVNTLKMSVPQALAWLRSPPPEHSAFAPKGQGVTVDNLLPDVLHFPPATDLHDHPLVQSSCLILQSKSSCMPAHALDPGPGWEVVDACAAPGNKTTHVAALMEGQGRVLAFDRDAKRLARLKANARAAAATNIEARVADFLSLPLATDALYRSVRGALVDPSCSGSGTVRSRMDHLLPSFGQESRLGDAHASAQPQSINQEQLKQQATAEEAGIDEAASQSVAQPRDERIERLARFQEAAVRHALQLPALKRLVYSTCSIHEQENEAVMAAVLPEAKRLGFRLIDPFPAWHRRGVPGTVEDADKLVRVDPDADQTDGFFIAVLERS